MRIYLAAAWGRKDEIKAVADQINMLGCGAHVDSRWLYEPKGLDTLEARQERAEIDVTDVEAADVLVRFSDDLSAPMISSSLATGARMVEMGFALAWGKKVVVVGGYQPIFDYLPNVIHLKDVDELLTWIMEESNG